MPGQAAAISYTGSHWGHWSGLGQICQVGRGEKSAENLHVAGRGCMGVHEIAAAFR